MRTIARWQLIPWLTLLGVTPTLGQQPTQSPGFPLGPVDKIDRSRVQAYAGKLKFDRELLVAADSELVDFGRRKIDPVAGTAVRIEPEEGAHLVSWPGLAEGRIIARIWSESADSALGIGKGYTWWWVDSTGGKWRSVFIPEAEATVPPKEWLLTFRDERHRFLRAKAKILFQNPVFWATCGSRCCLS